MKRTNEAFWWSLFSAGGVMAALFLPVFVLITGFVLPWAGDATQQRFDRVYGLLAWWPVRALLITVLTLAFFHCAHRIRHVLMDIGFRSRPGLLVLVCYGGALLGHFLTVIVVARL
jgi:fumarate reductase subunit D